MFDVSFQLPTVYQTKSIALNVGQTITNARIVLNTTALSNTNDFLWYLSADGGVTWETATPNTLHTFTTTGNDLRLQVLGNPGATITLGTNRLEVVYTYS